MVNFLLANPLF